MLQLFETHETSLQEIKRKRVERYRVRNVVAGDAAAQCGTCEEQDSLGVKNPGDLFDGDVHLRTLRRLLTMIDQRGFQRSPHQLRFHRSFESAIARVLYKKDWQTSKPEIIKRVGWDKTPSEVLISTPRRFGKTFSYVLPQPTS